VPHITPWNSGHPRRFSLTPARGCDCRQYSRGGNRRANIGSLRARPTGLPSPTVTHVSRKQGLRSTIHVRSQSDQESSALSAIPDKQMGSLWLAPLTGSTLLLLACVGDEETATGPTSGTAYTTAPIPTPYSAPTPRLTAHASSTAYLRWSRAPSHKACLSHCPTRLPGRCLFSPLAWRRPSTAPCDEPRSPALFSAPSLSKRVSRLLGPAVPCEHNRRRMLACPHHCQPYHYSSMSSGPTGAVRSVAYWELNSESSPISFILRHILLVISTSFPLWAGSSARLFRSCGSSPRL